MEYYDKINLTFPDGTKFYPDIKNGERGFNTDPARSADTFVPFSSGNTLAFIVGWGSLSAGSSTNPLFYNSTLFNKLTALKPCILEFFWNGEFRNNDGTIYSRKIIQTSFQNL